MPRDEGSRTLIFIACAIAIHVVAALALPAVRAVARQVADATPQWVTVIAPPAAPQPRVETPPPPPAPTRERAHVAAHAPLAPAPAAAPAAPAPAPAAEPTPTAVTPMATTATSTEGGLAVNVAVGHGPLVGAVGGTGTAPSPRAVEAGPDVGAARRAYAQRVRAAIGEVAYPRALRRRGIEGRVRVSLTIDANGRVTGMRVATPSGTEELDGYVLDSVRAHAASFPAPPPEAAWTSRDVTFGFEFSLVDGE